MVTTEDLSPGGRLPEPIDVEVIKVDRNVGASRRAEVDLVDNVGNELHLVDYEGANLSVDWKPNHQYRISRCSINNSPSPLTLTPSKRTQVDLLGPVQQRSSVLIIGDTHIGRGSHPKNGEKINPLGAFKNAVKYGLEREVDAVIHVGDIFHESATPVQVALLDQQVFNPLEDAGIPFYYVEGNHTSSAGDDLLADRSNVSTLDTRGVAIGDDVRIFGINHHDAGDIPWESLRYPRNVTESKSILILHQTIQQLSGRGPKSVDLSRIQQQFNHRLDFILSGHHHDATKRNWDGTPVMYTGASERMSKNNDSTDRVAWYLPIREAPLNPERYDIP